MDLPPKIIKREVQSRVPARGGDASLLQVDADGQSLPVLEAFQRFLEIERRKSRNRLIVFATFSLLLVVVLALGLAVVGLKMADSLNADVSILRASVEAVKASDGQYRAEVTAKLDGFAAESQKLRDELDGKRLAEKSDITTQIGQYNDDLEGLKNELVAVQGENKALKENLSRFESELSSATNGLQKAILEAIASSKAPVQQAPETHPAVVVENQNAVGNSEAAQEITVAITPPQARTAVSWLIPIPE